MHTYEWFDNWVNQNLGVCITVASMSNVDSALSAFDIDPVNAVQMTLNEADDLIGEAVVRVGSVDNWTYGIEHFSVRGMGDAVMRELSADGGTAISLAYAQTAAGLQIWQDSRHVDGFDLSRPDYRYGAAEHSFDEPLTTAGLIPTRNSKPSAGARVLELVTPLVLGVEILEGPATAGIPQVA